MKKNIFLTIAIFMSIASFAQRNSTINNKENEQKDMSKTDGVMMKNGTMMTVKNGKTTAMTSDLVCKDGTRVSTNGSVSKKDGSKVMLEEGEYMDGCGKVMPIKNSNSPLEKNNSKTNKDRDMYLVPNNTLEKNK